MSVCESRSVTGVRWGGMGWEEASIVRENSSQKRALVDRVKATRWESTCHLESHLGDRQKNILSEKFETCFTFSCWFILISPAP